MTAFHLASDEELRVDLVGGNSLRVRCPKVVETLAECAETVNGRFKSHGERARITINIVEVSNREDPLQADAERQ